MTDEQSKVVSAAAIVQTTVQNRSQPKNPLHGFTLEQILLALLAHYGGYPELAKQVKLKCFSENPSLKSSLNFLRKTAWARTEVEQLFIRLALYRQGSQG